MDDIAAAAAAAAVLTEEDYIRGSQLLEFKSSDAYTDKQWTVRVHHVHREGSPIHVGGGRRGDPKKVKIGLKDPTSAIMMFTYLCTSTGIKRWRKPSAGFAKKRVTESLMKRAEFCTNPNGNFMQLPAMAVS